jgi:hypothetical protein
MTRSNDQVITAIKSRHLTEIEALGEGDHAGVDRLKSKRGVGHQQF